MRRCLMLVAVVVAAASAAPAYGGIPDGAAGPWADSVVDFNRGTSGPGGFVPGRGDPNAALGPAENPPGPDPAPLPGSWVSIGFGGTLTLGFDNPICNGTGDDLDIEIREITREPYALERVNVFVSEDGVTYVFAGVATRDDSVAMPAGIVVANFVRLVDINTYSLAEYPFDPNADGFDVDGVQALNTSCPTGKLEICKSSANGMFSQTFQFSLNGGSPFSVRGGRCTGPITTRPGLNTIRELPTTPPTDIQSIQVRPSNKFISQDLDARIVQVKVASGSTAATETKVTFVNEPGGGATGELKICKVTNTPALLGVLFSFRVNGGPLISTEAGPEAVPALWSCRPAGTFQTGTIVTVQEIVPAGTEVDFIDTDPADRLKTFNLLTGTATLEIGGGQNVIIFDNEAVAPEQTGFIEICKDAALTGPGFTPDPEVLGQQFTFTVDPPDGPNFDVTTYAGQCTMPLQVAAGVVRVTEHAKTGFRLVDVFTNPDTALLFDNIINRTADVEVPVSASSNFESQVHFVNTRDRAQFKLCKALAPGSEALAGMTFTFDVTDLDAPVPTPQDVSIIAPGCKELGQFPVGHRIDVQEDDAGPFVMTSGEGVYVVGAGIETVTITNTALGNLRICKAAMTGVPSQPTFRFRIDMGAYINVTAGGACASRLVSVGNHTVTEAPEMDYELNPSAPGNGITVTPPGNEVSRDLSTRSVTVSVSFGGDTRVDYYNRVRQGFIVICKSLASTPVRDYAFDVYVDGQGVPFTVSGIAPGECSGPSGPFPVLRATDGQRTQVEVFEQLTGGYQVTNITCMGCRPSSNSPPVVPPNPNFATGYIRFSLAPNTNTVTYTNAPA